VTEKLETTIPPVYIDQRVTFVTSGGNVRKYHIGMTGTVTGFSSGGNPVIKLDSRPLYWMNSPFTHITDTLECSRVIDENGELVRLFDLWEG
jgi:hypothetical protein